MSSIVKKLGLKPGMRALVVGAPSGYMNSLAPLPDRVEVSQNLEGAHEFVQFFAIKKSEITISAKKVLRSAAPGALVWITYPKKTSGVESDLSREEVWAAMEGTGWRPVSQIAIDGVWSALRFRPTQDVGLASSKSQDSPPAITPHTTLNAATARISR
jgi:predicted SnoaL-like aldol condensation-catalyzing enzyme